jgi:hypothetical protein
MALREGELAVEMAQPSDAGTVGAGEPVMLAGKWRFG